MAISQTITDIPTPPSSSDATNFRTRADAFMASLDTLSTELNTYATQANALETNVNNKEASAVSASIIASGAANYQGDWSAGSYSLGQSVSKDGVRYISKINLNSDTPPSSNWEEIITAYGRNYIINGGFDYWNYATSQTSNGYGSDDRWFNAHIGSTKTHSRVASTDTERALFNSPYYSRTVATSVAGANNSVFKQQKVENVTKLAGKTITVSFWAKADSSKNIALAIHQVFGAGGSPSTITVTPLGLIALTSTWQKKTVTFTLPSIVGKTLGTDGIHTSSSNLNFWFDSGSSTAESSSNLGQQSGTFDIAEVKLEEGSVATPWTPYEGDFGGEIQACQRYYSRVSHSWIGLASASGQVAGGYGSLPVLMRTTPTITQLSVGLLSNTSAVNIVNTGTLSFRTFFNSNASGTFEYQALLLGCSAEL